MERGNGVPRKWRTERGNGRKWEGGNGRDFTINSLYLDISDMRIIDYTGGFKDLNNRKLSSIGDSKLRFREDPIRIIRAIRFLCNLDLKLKKSLEGDLINFAHLLQEIPPARKYEEILKLFLTGNEQQELRATDGT